MKNPVIEVREPAMCNPRLDTPADRKGLPRGVCRFCGRKALACNSRICGDGAEILARGKR